MSESAPPAEPAGTASSRDAPLVSLREEIRALVSAGQPTLAFELARDGLARWPLDGGLAYLRALALARGGNASRAAVHTAELLSREGLAPQLRADALALAGRLVKDRCARAREPAERATLAAEAARLYAAAHAITGDAFPGINAATLTLLAGNAAEARRLAATVAAETGARRARPGAADDHWRAATLGEAHAILGDAAAAVDCYRDALRRAAGRLGDIAAMRRNLRLLAERAPVARQLLDLVRLGSVVAYTGHMVDAAADPAAPRFPADAELERRVAASVDRALGDLEAIAAYGSAACGADIVIAERCLARGIELHVVLPYDTDDFRAQCVDLGRADMAGWRARFDAVLRGAAAVHHATAEPYLGEAGLVDFAATFTQGLALLRAGELDAAPVGLAVLEPGAAPRPGGTAHFAASWAAAGRELRTIDLAAVRAGAVVGPGPEARPDEAAPLARREPPAGARRVKAMLFADVKNFSKLREEQAPSFFVTFLGEVASVLESTRARPAFRNTWGDGLFLVYDDVRDCADFATRLLARIGEVDWARVGLPADTTVRLGLHAGPVYRQRDPIIDRDNFFGSHVNRAARIEPITTPGCAFASEQFAAALVASPGGEFACEYVGIADLAKNAGRAPLYRLERR